MLGRFYSLDSEGLESRRRHCNVPCLLLPAVVVLTPTTSGWETEFLSSFQSAFSLAQPSGSVDVSATTAQTQTSLFFAPSSLLPFRPHQQHSLRRPGPHSSPRASSFPDNRYSSTRYRRTVALLVLAAALEGMRRDLLGPLLRVGISEGFQPEDWCMSSVCSGCGDPGRETAVRPVHGIGIQESE
jgi:hypothetical protein